MATVNYAPDDKLPIDQLVDTLIVEGKPLRVRVQPDIYNHVGGVYKTWNGVSWTIECEDAEEVKRLREGLADFFKAFGGDGKKQGQVLRELKRMAGRG